MSEHLRKALSSIVYSLNFSLGMVGVEFDRDKFREEQEGPKLTPLDDAFARPYEELRKIPSALHGRRIVALIDDLDRCSPQNVMAVLESINLVMDVPGFVFVLALDYP